MFTFAKANSCPLDYQTVMRCGFSRGTVNKSVSPAHTSRPKIRGREYFLRCVVLRDRRTEITVILTHAAIMDT